MKRNKPNPVFESSATQDFDYVDSQESLETLIDGLLLEERIAVDTESVSYTHLTLPTKA